MPAAESALLALLAILFFGLVVPELFLRLKLPYVTSLILVGALLGPGGLGYVEPNPIIGFFGFLGFTFLMFLAGLESDLEGLKRSKRSIFTLALFNGGIPFLAGFLVGAAFSLGTVPSLVLGVIFMSSSVAIIIPTIKSAGLYEKPEGRIMAASIFVEDMASLLILAVLFQSVAPAGILPLPLYLAVLAASLAALWLLLPRLSSFFIKRTRLFRHAEHEDQTRLVLILLIATLVFFSWLGIHPILAAFLVGALLSTVITSRLIVEKVHTIGYGLFVPVFFFIIGMEMDLSILFRFDLANLLVIAVIVASVAGKAASGYFAARKIGFGRDLSGFFSIVSTPQLTTTLATAYAASSLGIIDRAVTTAVIALSVVTTLLAPVIIRFYADRKEMRLSERAEKEIHPA